jgi:hypothetical protein
MRTNLFSRRMSRDEQRSVVRRAVSPRPTTTTDTDE